MNDKSSNDDNSNDSSNCKLKYLLPRRPAGVMVYMWRTPVLLTMMRTCMARVRACAVRERRPRRGPEIMDCAIVIGLWLKHMEKKSRPSLSTVRLAW